MKVLHIIPHVHLGGADLGAIDMVRALNESGVVDARLCVFQGARAPHERLIGLGAPALMNFWGSHRRPGEYLKFRRQIRALVREWEPDIVHCHLWPACRWASMALSGLDVVHVWHVHDTWGWLTSQHLRDRVFRAWTRWLLTRVHPVLLSVSTAAAGYTARALDLDPSRFKRVSCGVDTRRFIPRPRPLNRDPVIGLAAQFRPEKGHDVLLRAVKLLADRGLRIRLRLAGDGATLEASRNLCSELNLEGVEFLGHVTDVPEFLASLDLFVLPSMRFEGLPLCILEAMTMGVPVIATDVAGTAEVVLDGETGLLVHQGDPEHLADALRYAIEEPDQMRQMALNARRVAVDEYSLEGLTRRLEEIYMEACGRLTNW